jgi:hypothetical protein
MIASDFEYRHRFYFLWMLALGTFQKRYRISGPARW